MPAPAVTRVTETRFAFGENWRAFLDVLTPDRIEEAARSLREMLSRNDLAGVRFLDIGSGSGLFSLAARRLGARVHSFDYDAVSVACTNELKDRYFPDDPEWTIERGSVLDAAYIQQLGHFDVVYSWGVLHHTGAMWVAIDQALTRVAARGVFCVALYNDQGTMSVFWKQVKRSYNRLPRPLRFPFLLPFAVALETAALAVAIARLEPRQFMNRWTRYAHVRGMSRWHDIVDWVGGYPFEVATPEAILHFCGERGFEPTKIRTCGGRMGCNEFVFRRRS